MKKYKVKRKCYWCRRIWAEGEIVNLDDAVVPPEHFEIFTAEPEPVFEIAHPDKDLKLTSSGEYEEKTDDSEKPEDDAPKENFFELKAKVRKLGIEVSNKDSKETVLKKYEEYKQMVAEAEKAGIEVPDGATREEVLALIGG